MEKKEIKIDKLHVHVWDRTPQVIVKEIDAPLTGVYIEEPVQEGDYLQFGFAFEGKWFEIRAAVK